MSFQFTEAQLQWIDQQRLAGERVQPDNPLGPANYSHVYRQVVRWIEESYGLASDNPIEARARARVVIGNSDPAVYQAYTWFVGAVAANSGPAALSVRRLQQTQRRCRGVVGEDSECIFVAHGRRCDRIRVATR
jgi:hypothetical protein